MDTSILREFLFRLVLFIPSSLVFTGAWVFLDEANGVATYGQGESLEVFFSNFFFFFTLGMSISFGFLFIGIVHLDIFQILFLLIPFAFIALGCFFYKKRYSFLFFSLAVPCFYMLGLAAMSV